MNDKERLIECCYCEYMKKCFEEVMDPLENEDGTCRTKEIFEVNKSNVNDNLVE